MLQFRISKCKNEKKKQQQNHHQYVHFQAARMETLFDPGFCLRNRNKSSVLIYDDKNKTEIILNSSFFPQYNAAHFV